MNELISFQYYLYHHYPKQMPSVRNCLKNVLRHVDLFSTTQFLRYNGEDYYATATGGVISIAVISILVILFAGMGVRTINKQIITSNISHKYEANPTKSTFRTSPEAGFMFAIFPWNFNIGNQS